MLKKQHLHMFFLIFKGHIIPNDDVGVATGTVFSGDSGRGSWFPHPVISFKKSWGGLP